MIDAEAKNNEVGHYRILSEGIDNDHDEAFNEDGPGGVSPNRNFTFRYPVFAPARGRIRYRKSKAGRSPILPSPIRTSRPC